MTTNDTQAISPHDMLRAIWRRWPLVTAAVLFATGGAIAWSLIQTPQYQATSKLLFRDPGFDQRIFGSPVLGTGNDADRRAQTNAELVSLGVVAARTATALNAHVDAAEVDKKIQETIEGQSDIISITATDPNPHFAARLANEFASQFIAFRKRADRAKVREAIALVEHKLNQLSAVARAGGEGKSLEDQLSSLKTLSALQTGNAELVQLAEAPEDPSSPRPVRNAALALVLGLVLGMTSALVLARLDRRIRDVDELESIFALPTLSTIPDSESLRGRTTDALPFADAEPFRLLRTRLRYFNVDREVRSVLVTSSVPQEGKTTVAWNLARSAAEAGSRVAILDADFHQSTLAERHGLEPFPGLAELLTDQVRADRAIQQVVVARPEQGGESRYLAAVTAGAQPPNPLELVESEAMAGLLRELSELYDLVVIDTPPLSVLAYSIPLMKLVSGVIVVARLDKTTRDDAHSLLEQLTSLNVSLLGTVANRAPKKSAGYGYGYGYGGYGD